MGNKNSSVPPDISKYENWYRLALSLELCVKPVLLSILHDPVSGLPKDAVDLYKELLLFKQSKDGKRLSKRNTIREDQWDVMCHTTCKNTCSRQCPRDGKTNSDDFDITLIVVLIKEFCNKQSVPGNAQQNDNVDLARKIRNDLIHTPMKTFEDEQEFINTRKRIHNVLLGLGVTDFTEFDNLKTAPLNHRAEEKIKLLEGMMKLSEKTETEISNLKELINELKDQLKFQQQNSASKTYVDGKFALIKENLHKFQHDLMMKLENVETIVTNGNKSTLRFKLTLDNSSKQFPQKDIKLNGSLHIHVVDCLETIFARSCQKISDPIYTTISITEIAPVVETFNEGKSSRIKFTCKVDSIDQARLYENLKNSRTPTSIDIIKITENNLPLSLKAEFGVDTYVSFQKWEFGSLLIDIVLDQCSGNLDEDKLSGYISNFLKGQITDATAIAVKPISLNAEHLSIQQSGVQKATNVKYGKGKQQIAAPYKVTKEQGSRSMNDIRLYGTVNLKTNEVDKVIQCLKKYDDGIFAHASLKLSLSPCCKVYHFDSSDAGIIIGKGGQEFKELESMPGIDKLFLDTRSSPTQCTLKIEAQTHEACQNLIHRIQKKKIGRLDNSRYTKHYKQYIIAEKNEVVVLHLCDPDKGIPVIKPGKDKIHYAVESFRPARLDEMFGAISVEEVKNDFQPFSVEKITKIFQTALDEIDVSQIGELDFNVLPGKTLFFAFERKDQEKFRTMNITQEGSLNPKKYNLKPIYQPLLNPSLKHTILKKMEENLFSCQTKDTPESYTTVHMYVVNEKKRIAVRLALDKNLDGIEPNKDFRLSEEKRITVNRILEAKTAGEVLQGDATDRINYHKLCRLLHPDKNLHAGATQAFQRLHDAFGKSQKKDENWQNKEALPIDSSKIVRETTTPPKVVSIKIDKRKLCSITTFSKATLDVRAALMAHTVDNQLSEQVKSLLETCWEKRDKDGGIPTPDGEVNIYIWCIKQITAAHIWVKEISTTKGTALLEVTVKEIREKVENANEWRDCIEIDMNLQGSDYKKMSAKEFTDNFVSIKEEWENICPVME